MRILSDELGKRVAYNAIGLCCSVIACLVSFSVQAWPEFDKPEELETEWVADNMVYNGIPMWIENFHCECDYNRILNFYRRQWEKIDERGFVENDLGDFKQISRGDERYFFSVQVKADPEDENRSIGRLSIMKLPGKNAQEVVLGEGIPKLDGSEIIDDVYDAMPGKRSRTVLMVNRKSIVENMDFYRRLYEGQGWNSFLAPANPAVGSQALSYRKNGEDVNIAIYDQEGISIVLFNSVK